MSLSTESKSVIADYSRCFRKSSLVHRPLLPFSSEYTLFLFGNHFLKCGVFPLFAISAMPASHVRYLSRVLRRTGSTIWAARSADVV
jgi:hypothetical protein